MKECLFPVISVTTRQLLTVILGRINDQFKKECGIYPCSQCEYKATRKRHLRDHVQSVHEGVVHPCNLCDYKTTNNRSLTKHVQSIHEGLHAIIAISATTSQQKTTYFETYTVYS